jgi:hypothetical protein
MEAAEKARHSKQKYGKWKIEIKSSFINDFA